MVSSCRNSALSSACSQPVGSSCCQKNQQFCHVSQECCSAVNASRTLCATAALNVNLPCNSSLAASVAAANLLPVGSTAGSSSGSSSQGDVESGVSFSSMSSLENIDEYFLEDPLDLNALFADGLSVSYRFLYFFSSFNLIPVFYNVLTASLFFYFTLLMNLSPF